MDTCKACSGNFDQSEKCVLCSGLCGKVFHPGCVGLNVTNFKAWTANVGLLWFCESCRVNFNPIVMNREAVIIKTMRDVLLRVDSLDLRVGQFGENLKTLNGILTMPSTVRRESNISSRLQQFLASGIAMNDSTEFFNSIDRINLDSSLVSNVANNTIVGDDDPANITSINSFTTTTAPNSSPAPIATIVTNATTPAATTAAISSASTVATATVTTATTTTIAAAAAVATTANASDARPAAPTVVVSTLNNRPTPTNSSADDTCRLKVVNKNRLRVRREQIDSALKSFYVTPFHNGQTVEDVIEYLREVVNTDNSRIDCVKLVPRNKNIDECTFISFKVSVSEDLASIVSDPFYWPEGVEIREFRPKNDSVQISVRPT